MKRLISLFMVCGLTAALAWAAPPRAKDTRARRHHVEHHHAHKAKHRASKRHFHSV